MSKWEREPKQHYRESPWAPFDLLGLFPLKSQLSKTFFFLNSVILLLEPSLLFQIHLPPTLPPSCSVIGGDGALSAMRGPAHQSESVVMPLQSDTGGAVCWFSLCGEGGVKGTKKEWRREGLNCLRAAVRISSAQLRDRGTALSDHQTGGAFLMQKQNRDKQGGCSISTGD